MPADLIDIGFVMHETEPIWTIGSKLHKLLWKLKFILYATLSGWTKFY